MNNPMNGNQNNQNTITGLEENVEALLAAVVPLALTFVPHVKFLAWVAALAAVFTEKKSSFVRLCAGQVFAATFVMFLCSTVVDVATGIMNHMTVGLLIFPIAVAGILLSLVQIACVVFIVMIGIRAYRMQVVEIPVLTDWVKKIVKY